ncbi:helix-turn-helix transcriptional regulator [Paenibacillus sp. KR2-11]|uniref:helix-turn-helix transcriptional regulator n=1 Tax=Paenibacillus sp. KR2-11 TaxID=3385500 RepID=UPI0038FCC8DE
MSYKRGRCRIKPLLKRMGRTQRWLAEQTGRTEQQISDWANDRSLIHMDAAKNIAHYLKCGIDDLYEWAWDNDD